MASGLADTEETASAPVTTQQVSLTNSRRYSAVLHILGAEVVSDSKPGHGLHHASIALGGTSVSLA
jgi:hypothetical protein